jgi:hypothetical protein
MASPLNIIRFRKRWHLFIHPKKRKEQSKRKASEEYSSEAFLFDSG